MAQRFVRISFLWLGHHQILNLNGFKLNVKVDPVQDRLRELR
jgi:hypothetical protein